VKLSDALAEAQRLFIDTAPVIYHVQGAPPYSRLTDAVFARIGAGQIQAVTSAVTLAECLVLPYRMGNKELADSFLRTITQSRNTLYVGVDNVVDEAAKLRANLNLTLTDALQVAAALAADCDAFLTNDHGLRRVSQIPILLLDDLTP